MKLLLCAINTKYIHSNLAVCLLQAYACAHMKESKSEIEVAEYTINNRSADVLADLYEQRPDAIFFSCYIWNREYVMDLLPDLHMVLPDMDLWLGGPEVSFDAEAIMRKYDFLTGIMLGEGEATFLELVQNYYMDRNTPLTQIRGICCRQKNAIVTTSPRPLLPMDEIPFIYNDENLRRFEHKILYYESSRGCPFSCSYCLSSVDKTVRLRSLEKVLGELQFFLDHNVQQVKFVDRTFNVNSDRTCTILQYLLDHDNGKTNFHFEIAGDLLRDPELAIMEQMRPGLIQLEIGVQSVNPDTLRAIHRVSDLDRLRAVTERIRKKGNIHIHLDLIAGLPYEDYDSFGHSFNEVYSMKPAQLQLGFLKVLKGSPMEASAAGYGILYTGKAPYEVLSTNWISFDQLIRLKEIEEMVELYYNSMQFTATMALLEQEFPTPFTLYETLAQFYRQKGYFTNTPSRLYRYQVLLDFILNYAPERERVYRELLTFDLYFREHLKSRPEFAPDQTPYKDRIRALKLDKELHAEVFHYPVHGELHIENLPEERLHLLVFDYCTRDPLNHNAAIREFPLEGNE